MFFAKMSVSFYDILRSSEGTPNMGGLKEDSWFLEGAVYDDLDLS